MRYAGGCCVLTCWGSRSGFRFLPPLSATTPKQPLVMSSLRRRGRSSRRGLRSLARRVKRPCLLPLLRAGGEVAGFAFAGPAVTDPAFWAVGSLLRAPQPGLRRYPPRWVRSGTMGRRGRKGWAIWSSRLQLGPGSRELRSGPEAQWLPGRPASRRLPPRTCGSVPVDGGGLLSEKHSRGRQPSRVLEGDWSPGEKGDTKHKTLESESWHRRCQRCDLGRAPNLSEYVCKTGVTVF